MLNDADGDSVSDCDEVSGCTDQDACNFDANASSDNSGICIYAEEARLRWQLPRPQLLWGRNDGTWRLVCVPTLSADLD